MSKYSGIKFPFFGLLKAPTDVKYTHNTIHILLDGKWQLLDDKNKATDTSSYFNRLVCLDLLGIDRVVFNFTYTRMEQLLQSPSKWGVDTLGVIFDLSKKEKFSLMSARVAKVRNNLLWVKGISYPFEIRYKLTKIINPFIFVELVQIDLTWYLYKFTYKHNFKTHLYL